jgi:hypothetical protein
MATGAKGREQRARSKDQVAGWRSAGLRRYNPARKQTNEQNARRKLVIHRMVER